MYPRHITARLLEAMTDTPVVLLHGARQTGKSTLLRQLAGERGLGYTSLDEASVLSLAAADPTGFVDGLAGPTVIDEVQRTPGLFLAIKAAVDRDRRPGRFVLSGSAHVLLLPKLADALVGRVEIVTLWPLSQGELGSVRESFVDWVWQGPPPAVEGMDRRRLADVLLAGGFPEAVGRAGGRRRAAWFESYLTTLLQRDVRELAQIEGLTELPRLLALLAARTCGLSNLAELSRSSGLAQTTLKRYLALFETTFVLQALPAWSANVSRRLTKSPKLLLSDTGLAAHLLHLGDAEALLAHALLGPLAESFVALELRKQAGWCDTRVGLYHFRTAGGQEVDLLLERQDGAVVGLEVKSSATVGPDDFRGLKLLRDELGERFRAGYVLHPGRQTVPFGERLWAAPLNVLWAR